MEYQRVKTFAGQYNIFYSNLPQVAVEENNRGKQVVDQGSHLSLVVQVVLHAASRSFLKRKMPNWNQNVPVSEGAVPVSDALQ